MRLKIKKNGLEDQKQTWERMRMNNAEVFLALLEPFI